MSNEIPCNIIISIYAQDLLSYEYDHVSEKTLEVMNMYFSINEELLERAHGAQVRYNYFWFMYSPIICLKSVYLATFAECSSQFLIDRLGNFSIREKNSTPRSPGPPQSIAALWQINNYI